VSSFRAGAASAALAALLAGLAIRARAGTDLERTGFVEIALVAVAAAVLCLSLIRARGRRDGAVAVAAFALFAAITALSIGWSIAPHASFVETGRTLAYLAVFAAAVAGGWLARDRAPAVVHAVLLATVAITAYGLAARVWPGSFDESTFGGRISQPFDYWNALAGAAAVGIPAALWLATRRTGAAVARAVAYPAAGVLAATVVIAQSRGALLAAAVAVLLWLAVVPLRLRSLVFGAIVAAGTLPVAAWALSKDAFSTGSQPLAAREAVAGELGLMLLATVAGLFATGLVVEAVRARWQPSLAIRNRAGLAVGGAAVLSVLALTLSVATSDRGLAGTVSDRVDELTSDSAAPPTGGGRLASASSERVEYWRTAFEAFDEQPLSGHGAGAFPIASLRHRDDSAPFAHAHGFPQQTLADLGLVGGLAALALLVAWLGAAARATGLGPRRLVPRSPWTSERAARVALALSVVAYGVQSAVDWTWFVPGLTVIALVCAGFVVGIGPLPARGPTPPPRRGGAATPEHEAQARRTGAATPRPRTAAAAVTLLVAGLAVWTIWQPVAADRAVARGYELLDAGRPAAALREADRAREINGHWKDPLYVRADALADLGRRADALRALRQAAVENPRDPEPWLRISLFELHVLDEPKAATEATLVGLKVDPHSEILRRVNAEAAARIQQTAMR
jgi:hypothetical protein